MFSGALGASRIFRRGGGGQRYDAARKTGLRERLERSRVFQALLALCALTAVIVIATVAARGPAAVATAPAPPEATLAEARAALAELPRIDFDPNVVPEVQPLTFLSIGRDAARILNASVPFSSAPNPAAAPFVSAMAGDDLQRATDCLAAVVLWEAGGSDVEGQQAVAQVVLNRVRHPAFPNTVCGVVFQGSERSTGCQFTFTCDGAMRRTPSPQAWMRAQVTARQALAGAVYAPVGLATHYHTDWVVPYWSASLEKITELHTHLFFRWPKGWGTPPAFRATHPGTEPVIPQLASLSDVHKPADVLASMRLTEALGRIHVRREGDTILVGMDDSITAEQLPAIATMLCGDRANCRVLGWRTPAATGAAALVLDRARLADADFSFFRAAATGQGRASWDCVEFAGAAVNDCLSETARAALQRDVLPEAAPVRVALPDISAIVAATSAERRSPGAEAAGIGKVETAATAASAEPLTAREVDREVRERRERRCSAMRLVARAQRIGPCADRLD